MAKKKPIWQELGLTPVKNEKGSRIGFRDKEGTYIPERQFRKLAGTPMKGSAGYKERQAAKKEGIDFRPVEEKKIWKEIKEAAKKPGMTLEQFMTGKKPEEGMLEKSVLEKHNEFIDKQRKEALEFKKMAGTLTDKQYEAAKKDLEKEQKIRNQMLDINEQRKNPKLTRSERIKMEEKYRKLAGQHKKIREKIEKRGLVPLDDELQNLRYSYYHF